MPKITDIKAREVLDSRGNPTIQVDVIVDERYLGRATIPSGASTGKKEALELRDNDIKRYHGKGVKKACENVTSVIKKGLLGKDPLNQWEIDRLLIELDGTPNKSKLGANAILGVSLGCAKASAEYLGIPLYKYIGGINSNYLPVPFMNLINGGAHADNQLDIQEFMIVPYGFNSFSESLRAGSEIFQTLKKILKSQNHFTGLGDEGGFAPNLKYTKEAIELLIRAVEDTGYKIGEEVGLALDVAASGLYKEGFYYLDNRKFTSEELVDFYEELVNNYPLVSIEDPLSEEDWEGWKIFTSRLKDKILIVGDDIFVTNSQILLEGIKKGIANAILIKPNQIGTLTETLETIKLAKLYSYSTIISHRSGETEDTTIADLAVGTQSKGIKTGSLSRSERIAKYNRLLQIEEELGSNAIFWGKFFKK